MQVGIVAHVSRNDEAHALLERVDADVIKMDDADFFSIGESTRRCAENHMRVLTHLHSIATNGEWCVVLEDDAIPVPGFRSAVAAALKCAPVPLVGLYLGRGNPSGAMQRNIAAAMEAAGPWLTADFFIAAVGYAVRADLIPSMLEFIKDRDEELPLRITRWAQSIGLLTCYTHPSLVNHLDIDSTIYPMASAERKKLPRVAWEFGDRKDWRGEPVRIANTHPWSQTVP